MENIQHMSILVPLNLFAYLDIWPDVQDLLQYPAIYQRSGLRLGANQRSGSGQRSGILVSQRFGSGRRAKINLRLNTVRHIFLNHLWVNRLGLPNQSADICQVRKCASDSTF